MLFEAHLLELEHYQPNSVKQLKHPSPDAVFPSSHYSDVVMYVSPQLSVQTSEVNQFPPEHEYPSSKLMQLSLQPFQSPIMPPSSQFSP